MSSVSAPPSPRLRTAASLPQRLSHGAIAISSFVAHRSSTPPLSTISDPFNTTPDVSAIVDVPPTLRNCTTNAFGTFISKLESTAVCSPAILPGTVTSYDDASSDSVVTHTEHSFESVPSLAGNTEPLPALINPLKRRGGMHLHTSETKKRRRPSLRIVTCIKNLVAATEHTSASSSSSSGSDRMFERPIRDNSWTEQVAPSLEPLLPPGLSPSPADELSRVISGWRTPRPVADDRFTLDNFFHTLREQEKEILVQRRATTRSSTWGSSLSSLSSDSPINI